MNRSPSRNVAWAWICGALLGVFYAALGVSWLGWSAGLFSAWPLAMVLAGIPIVLFVGGIGVLSAVMGWLSRRGSRRLFVVIGLLSAPPVFFLLYAGFRYYLAAPSNL